MIVPIKIAKDLVEIVDLQGLHNHATLNFLWHLDEETRWIFFVKIQRSLNRTKNKGKEVGDGSYFTL